MTQVSVPVRSPGFAEQLATRAAFLCTGISMSSWAPLVPYAKTRLQLDDGRLGALLLCLGVGSMIGMPLAGALAARIGCRVIMLTAGIGVCCMLPILAVSAHAPLLAAALLVFGASIGSLDVAMNIQAIIVEKASGRAMMSGFHGMYSLGGICGAGSATLLVTAGATPQMATFSIVGFILLVLAIFGRRFLPYAGPSDAPLFVRPHGRVLLFGAVCFVLFLAEGSVLDWSGVFLTTVRHISASRAGLGYVAFSIAMTSGRLTGDAIVHAVGQRKIVLLGSLCAAGGFLLAISVPSTVASIIGFGLVGAGASNVVPVMFSAAGRQTVMPPGLAIAAITTVGYAGILTGPALVGFVAHSAGLSVGLTVVAGMLLMVSIASRAVEESPTGTV